LSPSNPVIRRLWPQLLIIPVGRRCLEHSGDTCGQWVP